MCATESSATDLCSLFWCPYSVCMCMNRSSGHTKFNLAYVLSKVERGKGVNARGARADGRRAIVNDPESHVQRRRRDSKWRQGQPGLARRCDAGPHRAGHASKLACFCLLPGMRTCDWTFVASCGLIIARKMSTNPVCGHECEEGFALRGHAPEAPCTPCRGPRRWLARCTDPGEAPRQACRRRLSVP